MDPKPGKLWYLHRVRKIPLDSLTKMYRLNRTRIYRLICEARERRGEVVVGESFMSKAWILARIRAGMTPQQMAEEAFCAVCTVYRRMQQYGIRPYGQRGNPDLRNLQKLCDKPISGTKEGENVP